MHSDRRLLVALDLDDTLYKECDYWHSGVRSVVQKIHELQLSNGRAPFITAQSLRPNDAIFEELTAYYGLPGSLQETMLWQYRLHVPRIEFSKGVKSFLTWCQMADHAVCVISNGRSFSQRQKLMALGLRDLRAVISEEIGEEKPSEIPFVLASYGFAPSQCVYIGDNPKKDFVAPNRLGWMTIGIKDDGRNIHLQTDNEGAEAQPHFWIEDFTHAVFLLQRQLGSKGSKPV